MSRTIRKPVKDKVILGIDPGTNVMGYGLLHVIDGKACYMAMGVIDMRKASDPYLKLGHIFERVTSIIDSFKPDEMAIEAPFFGKNVQSMLKLGRAQGVAIAAAIMRDIPIHEYAPLKIKQALNGNGNSSKEQVALMLQRILKFSDEERSTFLDATDALAAAYCHYNNSRMPESVGGPASWAAYARQNPDKVKGDDSRKNGEAKVGRKSTKASSKRVAGADAEVQYVDGKALGTAKVEPANIKVGAANNKVEPANIKVGAAKNRVGVAALQKERADAKKAFVAFEKEFNRSSEGMTPNEKLKLLAAMTEGGGKTSRTNRKKG